MRLSGRKPRQLQRILVVEDEPLVAFDMELVLRHHDFDIVATVDSVTAALDTLYAGAPIDLVIADLGLADGNGVMVGLAAQQSDIPILFSTAQLSDEARAVGTACILKPYRMAELPSAIDYIEAARCGSKPKHAPNRFTYLVD